MITPHETAQYGQMLRVSVVRETFSARISARAWETSKPSAIAPPTVVALRKPRRVTSTGHLLLLWGLRMSRATMRPTGQRCQLVTLTTCTLQREFAVTVD